MTKLKTLCASGALLVGSSTLALAQLAAPAPTGSHPKTAAPQNAPNSWVVGAGSNATTAAPAAVPSTQIASAEIADQRLIGAVKRTIENAGYSSVYGITPSLDGYTARAMESGQRVTVDVDTYGHVYRVPNQH
jgi:outer membrane receptor protein involved in Fe transport